MFLLSSLCLVVPVVQNILWAVWRSLSFPRLLAFTRASMFVLSGSASAALLAGAGWQPWAALRPSR
jgi:hypothetical protein